MHTNISLLLTLLDLAPQLQCDLGTRWPEVCKSLLTLAGRLANEGDTLSIRRDLDSLLDELFAILPETSSATLRSKLQELHREAADQPSRLRAFGEQDRLTGDREPESNDAIIVPVFYGTDRKRSDTPLSPYCGRWGEQDFGVAEVSVPISTKFRAIGELSSPKWWRLEFNPDTKKHVVLLNVRQLAREIFIAELRDGLATADRRDALIFVHGYNVSFDDAARRAAQLAVDLKFPGRTLLYSWSSSGLPQNYIMDEETIEWSTPHFEEFLQLAVTEVGADAIHLLAHSMGNRALVGALSRFNAGGFPPGSAHLQQVIFAAPDVNAGVFRQHAARFQHHAERFTLYASSTDLALKVSKLIHGHPRAGDVGDTPLIVDGIDTIDATTVDTSLLGLKHSYFGDKRSILNDIFGLVQNGHEPKKRFDLTAAISSAGAYWLYRP